MKIVLDIESYYDFFCVCTLDVDTGEKKEFVYYDDITSYYKLFDYIDGQTIITFNGIQYDMPVLDYVRSMINQNNDFTPYTIYRFSQDVIDGNYQFDEDWCRVIDLFKIKHFDNAAKRTSLKQLEIAMQMDKVMDLPYDFTKPLPSHQAAREVIDYCHYDVLATKRFYDLILPEIETRNIISENVGFDTTNMNEPQIGSEVTLREVAKQKNMSIEDVRKMRTNRGTIKLSDCIIHERLSFPKNHKITNIYGSKKIKSTKGELRIAHAHKGIKYVFGTGGLHGARTGYYSSDDSYIIMSSDVSSYYPNLSIVNNLTPKHIGTTWIDIEKRWYEIKSDTKKSVKSLTKGTYEYNVKKAYNALSKLLLNGGYGKSKDKYSFMFDPKYTMDICINGQLQLFNIVEDLSTIGKVIMANTDGFEVMIKRSKLDDYYSMCDKWMKRTELTLEHDYYDRLYVSDVNNYIGIKDNAIVKRKGAAYETREDKIAAANWHKDFSYNVVRIAMSEYVLNGTDVADTITNHDNIWDFMISSKANYAEKMGQGYHILRSISDGKIHEQFLQKNIRYVATKTGGALSVYYPDVGEYIGKCKGNYVTLALDMPQEFDINYNHYIQRAKDIINKVEGTAGLFDAIPELESEEEDSYVLN